MNTKRHILLTASAMLLFHSFVFAQYYGNGGRYGRQRSAIPRTEEPVKKEDPLTAEEIVEREMPKITEHVGLNAFEEAVVRTILTKYVQQQIEMQILNLEPEQMREGLEKIRENQKADLKAGLPEEKYNALLEMQEKGIKKKKRKKKGKKPKT